MVNREKFKVTVGFEKVTLIPIPETFDKMSSPINGFYYSPLNWNKFYHIKFKNWYLESEHLFCDNLLFGTEISIDDMKESFMLTKIQDGKATLLKFDADGIPTKETITLESGIYSFALTTDEVKTNGFCYKVTN